MLQLRPSQWASKLWWNEPTSPPIGWDSKLPRHARPFQELNFDIPELEPPHRVRATVHLCYQLHAYDKQQHAEKVAKLGQRFARRLADDLDGLACLRRPAGQQCRRGF